jgi:hypothetical protein
MLMQYWFLTEMHENFNQESTADEANTFRDLRRPLLERKEAQYKAALLELSNLRTQAPGAQASSTPPGGTMADRKAFFESRIQQQAKSSKAAVEAGTRDHLAKMAAAKVKVENLKRWLTLQGAVLTADQSGIDWSRMPATKVIYDDDPALQNLTQLRFDGRGHVFLDDLHQQPFDTTDMVTHFSGPGHAIYVMSYGGDIHVTSHKVGWRHHSSLLGGHTVAGAGEVKADRNGVITWISNKSGHYAPQIDHFLQVLHQLQKKGISLAIPLRVHNAAGHTDYASFQAWTMQLAAQGLPTFEEARLLRYSTHLQDAALLASHNWRLYQVNAGEAIGVYEIASNRLVPHKQVRQWLKGQGLGADHKVQPANRPPR